MNFNLGDRLRGPLPAPLCGLLLLSLLLGGGPSPGELGCGKGWRQPVLQPLRPLFLPGLQGEKVLTDASTAVLLAGVPLPFPNKQPFI